MIATYPIPAKGADYYGLILKLADEAESLLPKGASAEAATRNVVFRHYQEVAGSAVEISKRIISVLEGRIRLKRTGQSKPEQTVPGHRTFVSHAAAAMQRLEDEAPVIMTLAPSLEVTAPRPSTSTQEQLTLF